MNERIDSKESRILAEQATIKGGVRQVRENTRTLESALDRDYRPNQSPVEKTKPGPDDLSEDDTSKNEFN